MDGGRDIGWAGERSGGGINLGIIWELNKEDYVAYKYHIGT